MGSAVITEGVDLSAVWPEVSRRLSRYLQSQGTQPEDAEDAVQECALRLLDGAVPWTSADDLLPWCITVARRHLIDLSRKRARLVPPQFDEVVAENDVHREVSARLSLQAVVAAWPQLSPRERASLADAAAGSAQRSESRREAVRDNVARHRARKRLQVLIASALSGLLGALGLARRRGPAACAACSVTVVSAVAVVSVLSLPSPTDGGHPDQGSAAHARRAVLTAKLTANTHPRTRPVGHSRVLPAPGRRQATRPVATTPVRLAAVHPAAGYQVTVIGHDSATPHPWGSVCFGGLPLVPDTCVD